MCVCVYVCMYVCTHPGKHQVCLVFDNVNTETPLSEFSIGGAMRVRPTVIVSFKSLEPQNSHFRHIFTFTILGDNLK